MHHAGEYELVYVRTYSFVGGPTETKHLEIGSRRVMMSYVVFLL